MKMLMIRNRDIHEVKKLLLAAPLIDGQRANLWDLFMQSHHSLELERWMGLEFSDAQFAETKTQLIALKSETNRPLSQADSFRLARWAAASPAERQAWLKGYYDASSALMAKVHKFNRRVKWTVRIIGALIGLGIVVVLISAFDLWPLTGICIGIASAVWILYNLISSAVEQGIRRAHR